MRRVPLVTLPPRPLWSITVAVLIAGALVARASATAPPVGPIPSGPVARLSTNAGELVAIALPRKAQGLVWRLARPVDPKVLRQVSEAEIGKTLVVVFRASGRGTTRVVFALTRGETTRAYASRTQVVRVT